MKCHLKLHIDIDADIDQGRLPSRPNPRGEGRLRAFASLWRYTVVNGYGGECLVVTEGGAVRFVFRAAPRLASSSRAALLDWVELSVDW